MKEKRMSIHFGKVTRQCTPDEVVNAKQGMVPSQPRADMLYPFDTDKLVPYCVTDDIVIYKKSHDYVLYAAGGLIVVFLLVLLVVAAKGAKSPGVEVVR